MVDQWVRFFSVSEPERHRKGFTVYKVTSAIYPRNAPEAKTEVVVWKRYSEFQKLHKELQIRHEKLYLKDRDKFPPFVKPRLFGRFEADVIEERRQAALSLLEFVANHPPLFTSQVFLKFFEKSHGASSSSHECGRRQDDSVNVQSSLVPPVQECVDQTDALSQSSSHSTLTDTDSTVSAISSPVQHESGQPEVNNKSTVASQSHSQDSVASLHEMCLETTGILSQNEMQGPPHEQRPAPPLSMETNESSPVIENQRQNSIEGSNAIGSNNEASLGVNSTSASEPLSDLQDKMPAVTDYMTQAGFHIGQAVEYETNRQYEAAFASYKAAIASLLGGVQDDPLEIRRQLVQNKAAQYLIRAEHIYHTRLAFSPSNTKTISKTSGDQRAPGIRDTLGHCWRSLESSISNLKFYKVLGVVSSVIVVLDTINDTPYIIKVLHKSPCPVDRRTKSVIPLNVPFMCHIQCFMENEYAVFLVLEQAVGGRLWDHIQPYLEACNNGSGSTTPFAPLFANCEEKKQSEPKIEINVKGRLTPKMDSVQPSNAINSFEENSDGKCPVEQSCISSNPEEPDILCQSANTVASGKETSIPDVVIQQVPSPPIHSPNSSIDELGILQDVQLMSHLNIHELKTENIVENSQKLLALVNKTLSKSEKISNDLLVANLAADNATNFGEKAAPEHIRSNSRREPKASVSKTRNSSRSRERNSSASRRPRSKVRFSCDDMFEGRARALSRSLDREALKKAEPTRGSGLPLDTIQVWAAQLLLALDSLHRWGVVIGDLRPDNLMLGRGLNLLLTYQSRFVCVDRVAHLDAIEELYAAPEVGGIEPVTAAADWWSFGAILFELLSGETLASCHPCGFQSYTVLNIPSCVPDDAANLLNMLLRYDPKERLGVGAHGVAKLKSHQFFRGIEWKNILLLSAST